MIIASVRDKKKEKFAVSAPGVHAGPTNGIVSEANEQFERRLEPYERAEARAATGRVSRGRIGKLRPHLVTGTALSAVERVIRCDGAPAGTAFVPRGQYAVGPPGHGPKRERNDEGSDEFIDHGTSPIGSDKRLGGCIARFENNDRLPEEGGFGVLLRIPLTRHKPVIRSAIQESGSDSRGCRMSPAVKPIVSGRGFPPRAAVTGFTTTAIILGHCSAFCYRK